MNPIRHSLAILWLRFRWEILAFSVIVAITCAALLTGLDARWLTALARIEALGVFWLTLRIVLADDGFKTTAGWRTRPAPWTAQLAGQLLLLVLILLPAVLLHALVILRLFRPTPGQWQELLQGTILNTWFGWLMLVIGLKLFATMILRPLEGVARKAAWSALAILLVPVLVIALPRGNFDRPTGTGGSGNAPGLLAQGIQKLLPDATEFLGEWNDSHNHDRVPQAKLIAAFPIGETSRAGAPGVLVENIRVDHQNTRTAVTLSLQALDGSLIDQLDRRPIAILRFSNGMYGTCIHYMVVLSPSPNPFLSTRSYRFSGTFISPRALPENHNAAPGDFPPTDLLFFGADYDGAPLPASLDHLDWGQDSPPAPPLILPPPSSGAAFTLAVQQLIDSLAGKEEPGEPEFIDALIATLPTAAIDPILSYHPWPDRAWEKLIGPFLSQHAAESHKPDFLRRLALDPRLTSLFSEKGWTADALPALSQRAAERLPLPADALALLAKQNDPALAADLAALAIRHNREIEEIAPLLRESAGFDWPAFVAAGWKHRKYGNYDYQGWLYARWAAELGDRSALRRLAEETAAGKPWERKQLGVLIPAAPDDLLPFLRQHLAALIHEPTSGTWRLPQ